MVFVVDDLPDDFPAERPLFLCVQQDPPSSLVGYRGTEHVDSDVYQETAFLRLTATSDTAVFGDGSAHGGDAGSERAIVVNGAEAVGFTMTTAEPRPFPWPGIMWMDGDITLWMLGEGMDQQQVLTAAESVRIATPAEVQRGGLLGEENCS